MYVAFYKYNDSGNHSHGVISIIFKWIAFFPRGLSREKSDIAWVFQDGGVQSKPHKIHLKNFYWFHWGLDQVQRPARKMNKLPAIVSKRKLNMRIFI